MNNFYAIVKNNTIVSASTYMNMLDFTIFDGYENGIQTFSIENGDYSTISATWNGDGSTTTVDLQTVSNIQINDDQYYITRTPSDGGQWQS